MKFLLHTCCAPCSVACVQSLRAEGIEPTAYWYNPNIHPYAEYRARRDTLVEYAARIGLALEEDDEYGLRPFTWAVGGDIENRCLICYAARMRQAARHAKAGGYTHFTTTLLISPYQNHERLRAAAEQAADEYGVEFLYRDYRPLFKQGQADARRLSLYMQKYCGCVFSEQERYDKRYSAKPPIAVKRVERVAQEPAAPREGTRHEAARKQAWPRFRQLGERFEAALAMETAAFVAMGTVSAEGAADAAPIAAAPTGNRRKSPAAAPITAAAPATSAPITAAPNPLVALLSVQTERTLWEARNVMRCAAHSGLWETVYCDMPVWRHVYHMLHSLDQWFMSPAHYSEPSIHVDGLNDLDRAVDLPAFTLMQMETYLAAITAKLRAYLAALPDAALDSSPDSRPFARLALIVAAIRHITAHFGMMMGFIIAHNGAWPLTIGMQRPLPTEDDGLPHYA